jgi:hypothetical protein
MKLKEQSNKTATQVELFSDAITHMSGQPADHSALVKGLATILNAKPEVRVFSSLISQDYHLPNPGEIDTIIYNDEILNATMPIDNIPTEFWPSLQTLRRTFSRSMGTSDR